MAQGGTTGALTHEWDPDAEKGTPRSEVPFSTLLMDQLV